MDDASSVKHPKVRVLTHNMSMRADIPSRRRLSKVFIPFDDSDGCYWGVEDVTIAFLEGSIHGLLLLVCTSQNFHIFAYRDGSFTTQGATELQNRFASIAYMKDCGKLVLVGQRSHRQIGVITCNEEMEPQLLLTEHWKLNSEIACAHGVWGSPFAVFADTTGTVYCVALGYDSLQQRILSLQVVGICGTRQYLNDVLLIVADEKDPDRNGSSQGIVSMAALNCHNRLLCIQGKPRKAAAHFVGVDMNEADNDDDDRLPYACKLFSIFQIPHPFTDCRKLTAIPCASTFLLTTVSGQGLLIPTSLFRVSSSSHLQKKKEKEDLMAMEEPEEEQGSFLFSTPVSSHRWKRARLEVPMEIQPITLRRTATCPRAMHAIAVIGNCILTEAEQFPSPENGADGDWQTALEHYRVLAGTENMHQCLATPQWSGPFAPIQLELPANLGRIHTITVAPSLLMFALTCDGQPLSLDVHHPEERSGMTLYLAHLDGT